MAKRNLLVAHGGGPTAVINASLAGVIREARRQPGVDRVLAARHGIEGVLSGDLLDLSGISESDLDRLERTPSSAIGSCRYKLGESDFGRIAEVLRANRVGCFVYTGGNDSMDTCQRMSEQMDDIAVAGVPKTIDNDLAGTDHSPGFGSAARYYAVAAAELGLEASSLGIQVSVLEVMGRNAGWLAASTVLARSLDPQFPLLVLVPERRFDAPRFLSVVESTWKARRGFVVVASEGLAAADGAVLGSSGGRESVDAFGHRMPGGVGEHLASLMRTELGIRARAEKPGLLGRASRALVSEVDRREAVLCGERAVELLCEGASGFMIGLKRTSDGPYGVEARAVDLREAANVERKLPDEYISEDGMDITESFVGYCLPLIGEDPFTGYLRIPGGV